MQERASDPRGQVVITRFECRSLYALLVLLVLHWRVKRAVRRVVEGFLGGATIIRWRQRTLQSISLWNGLESIYAMGEVQQHIIASRVPARMRVATSCGIYTYRGDWRQVMFDTGNAKPEPLFETGTPSENGTSSQREQRSQA